MPLYYLDIGWGEEREFCEALWFPHLEAAESEAKGIAEEIIRKVGVGNVVIYICDPQKLVLKAIFVDIESCPSSFRHSRNP